ncbi:MAG: DUF1854 domain-containing protein [Candidatus Poribacteria bacterium]|nr:DUF1854 domain-containing protein [Candidatus Poribacteria bacterium]MDE0504524.1 DUF1854 domain-containing protein [Candidatus Poribacteria bacterium]
MHREKQHEQKASPGRETKSEFGLDFDDDDFVPKYLNPERVRLYRSPMGSPRLEIRNEVCYLRVTFRRILPLSDPDNYISLGVGDDVEIGIVVDPSKLNLESRQIVLEELDKRYFTPAITRIHRVKERFGVHEWDVDTSRGRANFSVQGLHQNIKQVAPARILVTDVRGNRYDLPDYRKLDPNSFAQIQRYL